MYMTLEHLEAALAEAKTALREVEAEKYNAIVHSWYGWKNEPKLIAAQATVNVLETLVNVAG